MLEPLPLRRPRASQALLFVMLLGSYAYFFQGGGWNESSRLDLARAISERRTLAIDAYHLNTFDKSRRGDHFYSDKAPGIGVLGAPIHAVVRALRAPATDRQAEHGLVVASLYVMTVILSGAATAGTGVLVFRLALRNSGDARAALIAALGYGLGTLAFPIATVLFSHALATFLIFLAACWLMEDPEGGWRSVAAGLAGALAVVCEYPALPALGVLALAALGRGKTGRRRLARFAIGGAAPALVLLVYLAIAFGNPFRVGYQMLADPASAQSMATAGFIGMSWPSVGVMGKLLFSNYRGLFYYCPVLLLGVLGMLWAARCGPARRPVLVSLGMGVYFVLFVSSYAWWEGGSSFGSRHLAPMLPFLCWPMAFIAVHVGWLVGAVATISTLIALVITSVQPKPASHLHNPFFDELLPAFRDGKLARNNVCPLYSDPAPPEHRAVVVDADGEAHDAWNIGQRLGLAGLGSLLPLLVFWGLAGAGLAWLEPASRAGPRAPPSGSVGPPVFPEGLAAITLALGLGSAFGCGSGTPPPGTPTAPSAGWLVGDNCTETGRAVVDADAVARMADPPGVRACAFVGRWIAVRPGARTKITLEVHDPFADAGPKGVVEQRLYVDGRYVWSRDVAADAASGWMPVTHELTPRWPIVQVRLEVATLGMADPGGAWGSHTASAVRGLTVTNVSP